MLGKILTIIIAILLLPTLVLYVDPFQEKDGEVLDVLIIDGQSNAAYGQDIIDTDQVDIDFPDAPDRTLYYYGTDAGSTWWGTHNTPSYDTTFESYDLHEMWDDGWKVGGYEAGLGYKLSERSHHDTLILNIGVSGASVTELSPDNPMWKYGTGVITHALEKATDLNKYDSFNMLGYVWAQGEADYSTPIKEYESKFLKIMDGLGKYGADKCYIIATRAKWGNSVSAQYDLANAYSDITIATTIANTFTVDNGLLMADGTHYTQKGRDVIANIVGDVIDLNESDTNDIGRLFGVVIVVVIVGIVIAAVGAIAYRRAD